MKTQQPSPNPWLNMILTKVGDLRFSFRFTNWSFFKRHDGRMATKMGEATKALSKD